MALKNGDSEGKVDTQDNTQTAGQKIDSDTSTTLIYVWWQIMIRMFDNADQRMERYMENGKDNEGSRSF